MPKYRAWTAVTDGLPKDYHINEEEDRTYLVMIGGATFPTVLAFDGERWYKETFAGRYYYDVTHWLPLPPAPTRLIVSLEGKCGSCKYAEKHSYCGSDKTYVKCNNEYMNALRKRESQSIRARTNPACRKYERKEDSNND